MARDDVCRPCVFAVGVAFYNAVAKESLGKKDAKVFYDKVLKEKISSEKYFNLVKKAVKSDKKAMKNLGKIDRLMREELKG